MQYNHKAKLEEFYLTLIRMGFSGLTKEGIIKSLNRDGGSYTVGQIAARLYRLGGLHAMRSAARAGVSVQEYWNERRKAVLYKGALNRGWSEEEELAVVRGLMSGYTLESVAAKLGRSTFAISKHLNSSLGLSVRGAAEAARLGYTPEQYLYSSHVYGCEKAPVPVPVAAVRPTTRGTYTAAGTKPAPSPNEDWFAIIAIPEDKRGDRKYVEAVAKQVAHLASELCRNAADLTDPATADNCAA